MCKTAVVIAVQHAAGVVPQAHHAHMQVGDRALSHVEHMHVVLSCSSKQLPPNRAVLKALCALWRQGGLSTKNTDFMTLQTLHFCLKLLCYGQQLHAGAPVLVVLGPPALGHQRVGLLQAVVAAKHTAEGGGVEEAVDRIRGLACNRI